MDGTHGEMKMYKTTTGKDKQRSYNGDYMKLGKHGEEIVLKWLRSHPDTLEVDDYRQLKVMYKADVDCAIYSRDGRVALAEIKTDTHLGKSGNLLFEILRINHTTNPYNAGTLGWSFRSPAHWLLYYGPSVNRIYRISFHEFRRGFQRFTDEKRKDTYIHFTETDNIKSTLNVLIPEEYFEGIMKIEVKE